MIDEPIIVTGGSITITFDKQKYPANSNGHHTTSAGKIVSVDLYDENTGLTQTINAPENGKCTITVHTDHPA